MIGHGAFDDARELDHRGLRIAEQLGDERLVARMTIDEPMLDQFTGTGSWTQQIDRAKAIIKVLERYDDDFALSRAWNEVTFREITRGQFEAATVLPT